MSICKKSAKGIGANHILIWSIEDHKDIVESLRDHHTLLVDLCPQCLELVEVALITSALGG